MAPNDRMAAVAWEGHDTVSITWGEFSAALAEQLSCFEESTVLVLVEGDRPEGPYTQMWQNPDYLWVEASSSRVLGAQLGVAEDVEQSLADRGWTPPAGRDNWRRGLPWPARPEAYLGLAGDIVAVWRDVFGVESPAQLRYRGFISAVHETLVLPELGLEPAPA
jgi:hypothetical protein